MQSAANATAGMARTIAGAARRRIENERIERSSKGKRTGYCGLLSRNVRGNTQACGGVRDCPIRRTRHALTTRVVAAGQGHALVSIGAAGLRGSESGVHVRSLGKGSGREVQDDAGTQRASTVYREPPEKYVSTPAKEPKLHALVHVGVEPGLRAAGLDRGRLVVRVRHRDAERAAGLEVRVLGALRVAAHAFEQSFSGLPLSNVILPLVEVTVRRVVTGDEQVETRKFLSLSHVVLSAGSTRRRRPCTACRPGRSAG